MSFEFSKRRVGVKKKQNKPKKIKLRHVPNKIWAPPVPPKGSETYGSAKGPRFEARNRRIRWLIKNKYRLRNHILKGTIRELIREMKSIGLYASTTVVGDIEMGFPNLIYCVQQAIGEEIFASSKPTRQYPELYHLPTARNNVGLL